MALLIGEFYMHQSSVDPNLSRSLGNYKMFLNMTARVEKFNHLSIY